MTQETLETGLPAWVYVDEDFLALEREKIFLPSWQIICHESDIAESGSYATLNFMGALVLVIRGDDGVTRAFKNLCRHRAARLLDEPFGKCSTRIVCPYHAWTYDLKGQLLGVPNRDRYDDFKNSEYGLVKLDIRSSGGFLFVRTNTGSTGQSFDDFIAPLSDEFEIYQTTKMRALGRISLREREINWKIAVENYVDAFHLPVAHNGLNSLVRNTYTLKVEENSYHINSTVGPAPNQSLSARSYLKFLPDAPHLPPERRRGWVYKMMWPNLAFDMYPDQIDFMQFIPLSAGRTMLREISYALPDDRREMKAARYLNWRINREVNIEDKDVIERVQAGLHAGDFHAGPIARDEICLRDFTNKMRELLPVCIKQKHPGAETLQKLIEV